MSNISNDDSSFFNRLFNQTITIQTGNSSIQGVVEGWAIHTDPENKDKTFFSGELVVRIDPRQFQKADRKYFKEFMCLNPRGERSCLYVIPKEIVRQNVEGKITQTITKRTNSKR